MRLRDYQESTVSSNEAALEAGEQAVLNGMFTGAGKTVQFSELASRIDGRTLIVCHMRELVWQAVEKMRAVAGIDPDIEMADWVAADDDWCQSRVVVASKQTLLSKRGGEYRYKRLAGFRLVIADEAHQLFSPAVLEMFRWFQSQGAMVSGWTATPFRMDGKSMMDFYGLSICNLDLQWAIDNGWAVPPLCKLARVDSLDLSGVSVSGEDFNQAELQAQIEREATLHRIALITKEEANGPTVVFTPSVASAKGVCHYLTHNYGLAAEWVSGSMPEEDRERAIRRFKSGDAQVLVNCQVVAVGFDHPAISTLVLGRPTRSRIFWLQAAGRATRPLSGTVDFPGSDPITRKLAIAASGKPNFKIVDCTDSSLDHRIVTSVDMFCGGPADVVKEVRKQAAASQEPLTQEQIDDLARRELERMAIAKEIEERRRRMTGQATGNVIGQEVDIRHGGKRSIGTYKNPLRGKYAGVRMCDLPDHYIQWACKSVGGWPRTIFQRERARRHERTR